ncbi:hypothetical protein GJ496_011386 [Pomphorhynchus laevis]|nr:hypothetical protein GJ496_009055 [Pomphorhynchus laevis]KAI0985841.1 hypothetical protein GJ496_011386 [Pomphorhynchus laevis]
MCRYSHDISTAHLDDTCHYNEFGLCRYADRCRYRHVRTMYSSDGLSTIPFYNLTIGSEQLQHSANRIDVLDHRIVSSDSPLCCFYQTSGCCDNPNCENIHGEYCALCKEYALDPNNTNQRNEHDRCCNKKSDDEIDVAVAVQSSLDKVCSICWEAVINVTKISEAKFGLLQNCNHIFCLNCIRQWRAAGNTGLDHEVEKTCPVCRVPSDFVVPSNWFCKEDDKHKIINKYLKRTAEIHCTYFNFGAGQCPYGRKCIYRHLSASTNDSSCDI